MTRATPLQGKPVQDQTSSVPRRLLNRLINPYRLNDSAIYRLYLSLRHPEHLKHIRRERNFYEHLIAANGGGTVFDIGANCGSKAVQFLSRADRVICVEPDPAAAMQLQARFGHRRDVIVVNKGVGRELGDATFYILGPGSPLNTFSHQWYEAQADSAKQIRIPIITLDQLIDTYGIPSFIKIDVEGYELEVLHGLNEEVRLISFECNLSHFRAQALACIERLDALQHGLFNYCLSEPPTGFASERWLSAAEISAISASGVHDYIEIYFLATGSSSA